MNVKGFKDITGQEFVAEVINCGEHSLVIKNPICLVPTEKGMMPVPYLISTQEEVTLNRFALMFDPFDVIDNIGNFYKEKFGGIVQPPTGLIL